MLKKQTMMKGKDMKNNKQNLIQHKEKIRNQRE